MEPEFWHERWRENRIGFHEGVPNDLLVSYFNRLGLRANSRVFVPLCGKAVDLDWLMEQGHRVVGAELNRSAVEAVFERMKLSPSIEKAGNLTAYRADGIDIFQGDVFELSADMLGPVDAVFDRAALVALPADMRKRYAALMAEMTGAAPQLLICFDYDQSKTDGPPFSVTGDELERLYGEHYRRELLVERPMAGPIAERAQGKEIAWLLTNR